MTVAHLRRTSYTHQVSRPAPLGNPFSHRASKFDVIMVATRDEAIRCWELYARGHEETVARVRAKNMTWIASPERMMELIKALPENAVLGCWCAPEPCHADVIVQIWKELHA